MTKKKEFAVTVVVNTFNHEDFILQCIESIASQDFKEEFEILIIDDASTDKTNELVCSISEFYPCSIRIVSLETNEYSKGLWPGSRYFRESNSEFLAFCDGDDYWIDTEKISKQVSTLRNFPEINIVHTDYFLLQRIGERWHQTSRAKSDVVKAEETITARDLVYGNNIKTSTVLMRKDHIDFSFFEDARSVPAKDWLLFLTSTINGKALFMSEKTVCHRVTDKGIWNGLNELEKFEVKNSLSWYCATYFPDKEIREVFRNKVILEWLRKKISSSALYKPLRMFRMSLKIIKSAVKRKL